MSDSNTKDVSNLTAEHKEPFDLENDIDAKFKREQKAIDDKTPSEFNEVLNQLEQAAAHFKSTIPDFVCHLARSTDNDGAATFIYKETQVTLHLVKEFLAERGRDHALRIKLPNGKENNYRPYQHEEGLVWICDNKSGEDLVGTSKDFAAKIVEKCSRS